MRALALPLLLAACAPAVAATPEASGNGPACIRWVVTDPTKGVVLVAYQDHPCVGDVKMRAARVPGDGRTYLIVAPPEGGPPQVRVRDAEAPRTPRLRS